MILYISELKIIDFIYFYLFLLFYFLFILFPYFELRVGFSVTVTHLSHIMVTQLCIIKEYRKFQNNNIILCSIHVL